MPSNASPRLLASARPACKYVTCTRSDGMGAQIVAYMTTIIYAKNAGLQYVHTPITHIGHGLNAKDVEGFFSIGHDEMPAKNISEKILNVPGRIDIPASAWYKYIPLFKRRYYLTPKKSVLDPSKINVCVHVRRGDIKPTYTCRYTPNETIRATIDKIKTISPTPLKFHIFSEGKPEDFMGFEDVEIHLNGNVFEAFHSLVSADILVMAKSTFSYAAGILSEGIKIYENEKMGMEPMQEWLVLNGMTGNLAEKIKSIPVNRVMGSGNPNKLGALG